MDIDPDKYPQGPAGFQVCYENCYGLCAIIYEEDLGTIEVWGYGTFDRCVNGTNPSCTVTTCNGCGA